MLSELTIVYSLLFFRIRVPLGPYSGFISFDLILEFLSISIPVFLQFFSRLFWLCVWLWLLSGDECCCCVHCGCASPFVVPCGDSAWLPCPLPPFPFCTIPFPLPMLAARWWCPMRWGALRTVFSHWFSKTLCRDDDEGAEGSFCIKQHNQLY